MAQVLLDYLAWHEFAPAQKTLQTRGGVPKMDLPELSDYREIEFKINPVKWGPVLAHAFEHMSLIVSSILGMAEVEAPKENISPISKLINVHRLQKSNRNRS